MTVGPALAVLLATAPPAKTKPTPAEPTRDQRRDSSPVEPELMALLILAQLRGEGSTR